jgi:hypothetical protein
MSGTLSDLLNASARTAGIIQQNEVLTGENLTVCLYALNNLVDSLSNNRLLVYNISEYVFTLTGQETYTLGLGGDWNIGRPMRIESAYARLDNGTQQELDIAMQPLTFTQYANIAVKNTPSTFPFAYYDDGAWPLRTISLFPVPTGPADIVLWLREPLIDLQLSAIDGYAITNAGTGYTNGVYFNVKLGGGSGIGAQADITVLNGVVSEVNLTDAGTEYALGDTLSVSDVQVGGTGSGLQVTVNTVSANLNNPIRFPPGYERFFRYNLAVEIGSEFGKKVRDDVKSIALASKRELENLNGVPVYVRGDGGMSRNGRNRYFNWITGNFWSFGNN